LYHHQQQRIHHLRRRLFLQSKGTHPMIQCLFMLFNLTSIRAMLILLFVFMLFNLTSVRAMLTLVFVFMLFNLTGIRAMPILVSKNCLLS
jgi:hypothetical protein